MFDNLGINQSPLFDLTPSPVSSNYSSFVIVHFVSLVNFLLFAVKKEGDTEDNDDYEDDSDGHTDDDPGFLGSFAGRSI